MTNTMIAANTPGSPRERHAADCVCQMCAAYRRCVVKRAARKADPEAYELARLMIASNALFNRRRDTPDGVNVWGEACAKVSALEAQHVTAYGEETALAIFNRALAIVQAAA